MHGTFDSVVSHSHSVRLFAEAREPKELLTIRGGEHVDAMTERHGSLYRDRMTAFFGDALKKD
jgi:fermentation-respiration switch protein FrsA (DUF1100 family)